ncbi:MAG: hypothetical protein JXA99_17195 [Candidatus Lokiarchaeota archaeon]|nr:hypothetical protein [Candidatus Lokiarchaeota archaeon]
MALKIVGCHDVKVGDILECPDCGLQLEVKSECKECGTETSCGCAEDCDFSCCGTLLVKK